MLLRLVFWAMCRLGEVSGVGLGTCRSVLVFTVLIVSTTFSDIDGCHGTRCTVMRSVGGTLTLALRRGGCR